MRKKHLASLAPLLALAAFAVAPAVAQAGPQWLSNGVPLAPGAREPVTTTGTLTFHFVDPILPSGTYRFYVKCKVTDEEIIENVETPEGIFGRDEITSFLLTDCKSNESDVCKKTKQKMEVGAGPFPWATHLVPGRPPRDVIEGIWFEFRCGANVRNIGPASLKPKVSKSKLVFGPGSGEMEDNVHGKVTVTGSDFLKGPPGDEVITAA